MDSKNLKVGEWYWIAGHGPMRLKEATDPPRKTTLTFTQPGTGYDYYAGLAQVTGPVEADVLRTYIEQHDTHIGKLAPLPDELRDLLVKLEA